VRDHQEHDPRSIGRRLAEQTFMKGQVMSGCRGLGRSEYGRLRSGSATSRPRLQLRLPAAGAPIGFLRALSGGARARYGAGPLADKARRQIAHEIDVIGRLDLAGYFLIVWDLVQYCRRNAILVQGRGSAANSAVCYALGLTAVDPVKMELLFERFLSDERGEWPDIDLDLPSGDRREKVIQYVYERYGRLGAAMTANVIYRGRSAARRSAGARA
jgi:error-prone DNA polymerase